jgi:hypothetical protein
LDLGVDGIAQAEPLITQLGHVLCVEIVVWGIDTANGFQQAEWKQGVDRGNRGHGDAKGE